MINALDLINSSNSRGAHGKQPAATTTAGGGRRRDYSSWCYCWIKAAPRLLSLVPAIIWWSFDGRTV